MESGRIPDPFPSAWVARQTRKAPDWGSLFLTLSHDDLPDEAWFLAQDDSPSLLGNPAHMAGVRSWNGQTAVVEHDGACVLILQAPITLAGFPGSTTVRSSPCSRSTAAFKE